MSKIEEITCKCSHWISVKDRLPENNNDILVFDDNGRTVVSCFFFIEDENRYAWERRDDQIPLGKITHWMPFPEPPKEES